MKIYVCSPYRGSPPYTNRQCNQNLRRAAKYSTEVIEAGHTPLSPPLFFSTLLSDKDPKQRERGILMGLELLEVCDELWVFGDEISEGMKREIELAAKLGIAVVYKNQKQE